MLTMALALLLGMGPPRAADTGQGDSGKLQGVWVVTSWVGDGRPVECREKNGDQPTGCSSRSPATDS